MFLGDTVMQCHGVPFDIASVTLEVLDIGPEYIFRDRSPQPQSGR